VGSFREFGKIVARTTKQIEKEDFIPEVKAGHGNKLAKGAVTGLEAPTIAVAALLILLQYKINPALLVLGGTIIGALSFVLKQQSADRV